MSLSNSRKNILVIMSDQHNFEKTGAYGNSVVRTPSSSWRYGCRKNTVSSFRINFSRSYSAIT